MKKIKIILILLTIFINFKFVNADSLEINIYSSSNNTLTSNVTFGLITFPQSKIAPQFLKISYSVSNKNDWLIRIYTDNTNCTAAGYKNGLIGVNNKSLRIPLFWQIFTNTNNSITLTTNNDNDWGRIKDLNDIDWSINDKNTIAVSNNIIGCFPYSDRYTDNSNLYMYLGAHFYNCSDDIFRTSVHIDLLPNIINTTPGISYENIETINIIGDKIVIYYDISDTAPIRKVIFGYRAAGESLFTESEYYPDSKYYRLKAEIPVKDISPDGIEYYIYAENRDHTTNSGTNTIGFINKVETTVGKEGKTIILQDGNPEDGETSLEIKPNSLNSRRAVAFEQFYKSENNISGNGFVSGQNPIMLFNITPNINFSVSSKLTLLYFDLNNNGKVETISGVETSVDENTLAVCWWDGVEWRYIGGKIDTLQNIITVNISHTGIFGLFSVDELIDDNFRAKERIITPNGDGINDVIYFDGISNDVKIKIFNIRGRQVAELTKPQWDCRDSNGNIIESGVYIYQFVVNFNGARKYISGSFVVVK